MSILDGDLNVKNEIIELHFQVLKTQMILEKIIQKTGVNVPLNTKDVEEIDQRAIRILNKKFPSMGISKKII